MVYSYKRIKVTKTPFVFMILCSLFYRQFKPFFSGGQEQFGVLDQVSFLMSLMAHMELSHILVNCLIH